jgi:hypothetical protein
MPSMSTIHAGVTGWTAPIRRYERHLSAAAMVVGFAVDNFAFGRVDHPGAHLVFAGYIALAVTSILLAHWLQSRADHKRAAAIAIAPPGASELAQSPAEPRKSWRDWIPAATQFALGGLWSGFLVFYSRSAVLAASWPFLLLLLCFLIGNEVFRKYHSRFVFASLLLFFALYSYAVFVVPVFTHTIGRFTFLASGALAIVCFLFFLRLLSAVGHDRYRQSRWQLLGGMIAIGVAMNAFYFSGILPPLPLALSSVGIYHAVKHDGAVYDASAENQSLYATLGVELAAMHVAPGQSLYLYSAVFAPIKLTTRIAHRWRWHDPVTKHWIMQSLVTFAISGGRDGGYRAYSVKSNPKPGDWRVDIVSEDGRLIGRLNFNVAAVPAPVATIPKVLK